MRVSPFILLLCLLVTACASPNVGTKASDISASDLLSKGKATFNDGNYTRAAKYFRQYNSQYPGQCLPTAYEGIALWMRGKPDEMSKLWGQFHAPAKPALDTQFASRTAALEILAARLVSRSILADESPLPMVEDTVYIAPATGNLPYRLALHARLVELVDQTQMQAAPRIRIQALLAEKGIDLAASSKAANEIAAKQLGAEYVAHFTIRDQLQNNLIHTTLELVPLERKPVRIQRLGDNYKKAYGFTTNLATRAAQLQKRISRCDEALAYFSAKRNLQTAIVKRQELQQIIAQLQNRSEVVNAAKAMRKHMQVESHIASLMKIIKQMERRPLVLATGVGGFNAKGLLQQKEKLQTAHLQLLSERKRIQTYVDRFKLMRSAAQKDQTLSTTFTVPATQLSLWPMAAAKAFSHLAGLPDQSFTADDYLYSASALQAAESLLRAYDDGEYDRAANMLPKAKGYLDAPPIHPGRDFDPMILAAMQPDEIAQFFANDFKSLSGCTSSP